MLEDRRELHLSFLYTSQNPGHLPRTPDVIQVHFLNADLIQSPCDRLLSPLSPRSFSLRKPNSALLAVITGNRKRGEEFTSAVLCQRECIPIDVWGWKRWACGTHFLCNAIFKEILHNSSFFSPFFGEPSSKCHWQTLLIWHACEAGVQKSWRAWLRNFSRDGLILGW